jgi:hypothetical protein
VYLVHYSPKILKHRSVVVGVLSHLDTYIDDDDLAERGLVDEAAPVYRVSDKA